MCACTVITKKNKCHSQYLLSSCAGALLAHFELFILSSRNKTPFILRHWNFILPRFVCGGCWLLCVGCVIIWLGFRDLLPKGLTVTSVRTVNSFFLMDHWEHCQSKGNIKIPEINHPLSHNRTSFQITRHYKNASTTEQILLDRQAGTCDSQPCTKQATDQFMFFLVLFVVAASHSS